MKAIKVVALVLLSILLAMNTWVWMTGTVISRTVLNDRFYTRLFDRTDLPEEVQDKFLYYIADPMASNVGAHLPYEIGPSGLAHVNELYRDALLYGLGQDWVEEQAVRFISGTLNYWKGKTNTIVVHLSRTGREAEVIRQIPLSYAKLSDQAQKMLAGPDQNVALLMDRLEDGFILPDGEDVFRHTSMLDLGWVVEAYPTEASLIRILWRSVPYVMKTILMVAILLIARPNRGTKWIGSTFISSGIVFSLLVLAARIVLTPERLVGVRWGVDSRVLPFLMDIFRSVSTYALVVSGLVVLAGILILVARWLTFKRIEKKRTNQASTPVTTGSE